MSALATCAEGWGLTRRITNHSSRQHYFVQERTLCSGSLRGDDSLSSQPKGTACPECQVRLQARTNRASGLRHSRARIGPAFARHGSTHSLLRKLFAR